MPHESDVGEKKIKPSQIRGTRDNFFWGWACLDETILRVILVRFLSVWMPLESLERIEHIVEHRRHELKFPEPGPEGSQRTECL